MNAATVIREHWDQIHDDGYLVMESFLNQDENSSYVEALSRVADKGSKDLSTEAIFDRAVTDEKFISAPLTLLGTEAVFHHANGRASYKTVAAKPWHHDHDGIAGLPFSMLHLLVYPGGLSARNGALAVVPQSHLQEVHRSHPGRHGTDVLDGEVLIYGEPGVAVLMFSSLWHCRRGVPALQSEPRFDFNVSYCTLEISRPERDSYEARLKRMRERVGDHPMLVCTPPL